MSVFASPVTGSDPWAQAANNAFSYLAQGFSGPTQDERRLTDATVALRKAQADQARANSEKLAAESLGLTARNDAVAGIPGLFNRALLAEQGIGSQAVGPTPMVSMPGDGAYAPPAIPTPPPGVTLEQFRPELMGSATAIAYDKPGDIGAAFRGLAGNLPGVRPEDMTTMMMAAGDPYANTMPGFREGEANDLAERRLIEAGDMDVARLGNEHALSMRRQFPTKDDLLVAALQGGEGATPLADMDIFGRTALGAQPSLTQSQGQFAQDNIGGISDLSPAEQAFISAQPSTSSATPRNWINQATGASGITLDGVTDSATGLPIPPESMVYTGELSGTADDLGITNKTKASLEGDVLAAADYDATTEVVKSAAQDPTVFGIVGNVRRSVQNVVGQLRAVGQWTDSVNIDNVTSEMAETARAEGRDVDAAALTLMQSLYDPNLDEITKLSTLLAYKAASALAGQTGRGLSDKDFLVFKDMIGDPTGWFTTQESFLTGIEKLQSLQRSMVDRRRALLKMPPIDWGAAPPPAGAETGGGTRKVTRDENGKLILGGN